jgi:hypothetical protein
MERRESDHDPLEVRMPVATLAVILAAVAVIPRNTGRRLGLVNAAELAH